MLFVVVMFFLVVGLLLRSDFLEGDFTRTALLSLEEEEVIVPVLKMSSISDALVADFFAATLAGAGFAGADLVMTDLSVF